MTSSCFDTQPPEGSKQGGFLACPANLSGSSSLYEYIWDAPLTLHNQNWERNLSNVSKEAICKVIGTFFPMALG
jgi:hypothetical protein